MDIITIHPDKLPDYESKVGYCLLTWFYLYEIKIIVNFSIIYYAYFCNKIHL